MKELEALLDAAIAEKNGMPEKEVKPVEAGPLSTAYDETVRDYLEWQEERERMDMEEKKMADLKPDDLRIVYASLFKQGADISVPVGWNSFLARILELFAGYGLSARIERIGISRGCCLEASGEPHGAMRILNNLLALCEGICIRCGSEMEPNEFGLCQDCQKFLPNIKGEKRCRNHPPF